ncbi:hypothetical protein [Pseudomonas sp. PA-3-6E]|uniref:hypothetical protein n=1 Tax=Pseudomonas sp. PA-3-6E TaxID=2665474 RepID=UPI001F443097|nr:hypothetical protein [Pseudomonas sp. PA-3-6E]MCF5515922.1 hypothetical protein [Pseudomonas sp. PA-3-6E]
MSSRKRSDADIVTNTITLGRDVVEHAYHQMIHAASAFKAAKLVRDELRGAPCHAEYLYTGFTC